MMGFFTRRGALELVVVLGWTGIVAALSDSPSADISFDPASYTADSVITRDVCVIGGGSSGTYSAIGLRDLGKSVVVVEKQDRLGGHTHTYTDPVTKIDINYGVLYFTNLDVVKQYFARFDIPLTTLVLGAAAPLHLFADFRTGQMVAGYTPPNPAAAFLAYGEQLAKYPYLEAGFDLPDPIPPDLLLPFGDFVKKYALESAVSTIFSFAQGYGDLLRQTSLYVLKLFGPSVLRDIQTGYLVPADNNNKEIYEKALAELGPDALLLTRVLATDRNPDAAGYVKVVVNGPSGQKLILAKKIVLAIPPKLKNLVGFDLDEAESSLFGQFRNSAYYAGILRNTGIAAGVLVTNVGANTLYNLPVLPGLYDFNPTAVPDLSAFYYGAPAALPDEEVKTDVISTLKRLQMAGNNNVSNTTPEFAAFSNHNPFGLTVPVEAIAAGFYKKLYALQGQRRTYYTGATFHTHNSGLIWQFTQALLPSIAS